MSGALQATLANFRSFGNPAFLAAITSPSNYDVYGVTTDSQNNILMVSGSSSSVLKVSAAGVQVWSKYFPGSLITLNAIAVDSSDNVYVVGEQYSGSLNGVIIKLDSSGNIVWQFQQAPGSTVWYPRKINWRSVTVMPNGNIAVAGLYRDNVRAYDCCGIPYQEPNNFGALAVYNSSGSLQWARKFGTDSLSSNPPNWEWLSVSADSSNNLYVSGAGASLSGAGTRAVPIIKYNSSGTYQWGYQYKNSQGTISWDGKACVNSSGNIYAISTSTYQSYVLMVNSSGTYQWARNVSGTGSRETTYRGLAVDSSGFLYVGGDAYDPNVTAQESYGLYKFTSSGTLDYARRVGRDAGTTQDQYARAVAVSSDNFVSLGGKADATTAELFTRLKSDGSQTGTYSVGGASYIYSVFAVTATTDTPSVTDAKSSYPNASDDFAMTYTSSTFSASASDYSYTFSKTSL